MRVFFRPLSVIRSIRSGFILGPNHLEGYPFQSFPYPSPGFTQIHLCKTKVPSVLIPFREGTDRVLLRRVRDEVVMIGNKSNQSRV